MTKMKDRLIFLFASVLFLVISTWASPIDVAKNRSEANCKCYNDVCQCCEYIQWNCVNINGTICTTLAYLRDDYGISITLTWNNHTLLNETVSARNPPPFCFGIPDLEDLHANICLKLYDLTFVEKHFHGCAKLSIVCLHFIHRSVDLGCFEIPRETLAETYRNGSRFLFNVIRNELETLQFFKKTPPAVNMI